MNARHSTPRNCAYLPQKQQGIATVEAILLLPFLLLMLWLGSELIHYIQLQHRLHRATAALAEVIANPPIAPTEDLIKRLVLDQGSWEKMLAAMLMDHAATIGDGALPIGLQVSYIRSATVNEKPRLDSYTQGINCPADKAPGLDQIVTSGIRPKNGNAYEWIMLRSCLKSPARWLSAASLFPDHIASHFIAVRK